MRSTLPGSAASAARGLSRGEAASIAAHPRAPESSTAQVWEKTKTWELKSSPNQLWPYVSNTHRLNHAIGLPEVNYRSEMDPELGPRQFGSFRMAGLRLAWEEHPFEWIEGQQMGILREFTSGPFEWFLSVVTLESIASGGTRLSHQVRIAPRSLLGRIVTVVEADWKGFHNLDRVYRRIDRSISKNLAENEGSDPFERPEKMSASHLQRFAQRLAGIVEDGVAPDVAAKIGRMIREASPQELAQMHPLRLAESLQVEPQTMIDTCLIAASHELLQLRWDVLCPTCRAPASTTDRLSEIAAHTHCEACDIEFQSNVSSALEMVFRVHPEIREANDSQYCIGGPEHAPHVVAQIRLEPDERLTLTVDLTSGDYLIRGPRLPRTQSIRVRDTSAPTTLELTLSEIGVDVHAPLLRRGQQSITLTNDQSTLHVVRIERAIMREDVVTATAAASMPKFRELFPDQTVAEANLVSSEQVTLLALSINNMDTIYARSGDTEAYALTHELLKTAKAAIAAHRGAVSKTMGSMLLAAFDRRDHAVRAAALIRDEWRLQTPVRHQDVDLQIGIGIHCGATLVTSENDRLDYFGANLRAVTELALRSGNDTLITEVVATDPEVNALLPPETELETIDLPGIPLTRVSRINQNPEANVNDTSG